MRSDKRMIAKVIRDAIRDREPRLTYDQLAAKLGTTYDKLNNVANARTVPDDALLKGLREILGKPATWPYSETAGMPEGRRVSLAGTPMVPIPLVGSIGAGEGATNVDAENRSIYVPERLAAIGGLGWTVDGESMMPFLDPGDVAIFREHRQPRRGIPFLVERDDSGVKESRVKLITWDRDQWMLNSINPAFPPEPLQGWTILGYLVGWYRQQGTRETMDSDPNGLRLE